MKVIPTQNLSVNPQLLHLGNTRSESHFVAHWGDFKESSPQLCQLLLIINIFYIFPELLATVWLSPHNGPVNSKIYRFKELR